MRLQSFLAGEWCEGSGPDQPLTDPCTGAVIATASADGLDRGTALAHARAVGGPGLRRLTYGARAQMLAAVAETLAAGRERYFEIARRNSGNTRADAALDIDGAIGTLKYFSRLGAALGEARWLTDGGPGRLGRDPAFISQHIAVPRRGAAIHINAYNFPAWGLWGKAAVALLSGVPVLSKPATATAWLAQAMARDVIEAGVLPEGAFSILVGAPGDLLDHAEPADVIAFTGSAETARMVRGHAAVLAVGARVNIEADSLNAAILGPEATADAPEFALFAAEAAREITQKAGQKCTAIRRILVPEAMADAAGQAIAALLAETVIGDPANDSVTMGPLVTRAHRDGVLQAAARLEAEARLVSSGAEQPLTDADPAQGAFMAPLLLAADGEADAAHQVEAFGPVATILPYRDAAHAFALARRGRGALVASIFSADGDFVEETLVELADSHGRLLAVDDTVGAASTGHGVVMPMSFHGGPGRAGDGAEMGGLRSLRLYHQMTALQGPASRLQSIAERGA